MKEGRERWKKILQLVRKKVQKEGRGWKSNGNRKENK